MTEWQKFNVNEKVRVKLTERGRDLLRQDHVKRYADWPKAPYEYTPPREDADGWSEWQLWNLMQDLGHHCSLGFEPPFSTEIEFGLTVGEHYE